MNKATAKPKAGKDNKNKKDKTERADDVYVKPTKDKVKEKPRPRYASKKITVTEIHSMLSDEDLLSPRNTQTVNDDRDSEDVDHLRRKSCEDTVKMAVGDFFNSAWLACAERFFITSAAVAVSVELRNTWLRIVEAEWQDPIMKERLSTKSNRIFKPDEPPLPLSYDTWARGAIELLPHQRRESVLDPFLRDIYVPEDVPYSDSLMFSSQISEDKLEENVTVPEETSAPQQKKQSVKEPETPKNVDKKATVAAKDTGDEWNFELDPIVSYPNVALSSHSSSSDKLSPETQLSQISIVHDGKMRVYTLLSARPPYINDSITEVEYSSPNLKSKSGKTAMKKFSPSQCGGNFGSAVFRLQQETTTEALLKNKISHDMVRAESSRIMEQNALDREDIVQISTKRQTSHKFEGFDDDLEVQPLFEEYTPPPPVTIGENTNGFQLDVNRRSSLQGVNSKHRGSNLYEVASSIHKLSLMRRMVNLQNRFKRQVMRSLATRAKESETMMGRMNRKSSSLLSQSSLVSRSSNKTSQSRNKADNRNTIASKMSTTSFHTLPKSKLAPDAKRFTAKSTVSEPLLNRASVKQAKDQKYELPGKPNFSFQKAMANVRASQQRELRSLGGKFNDDKRTTAQLAFSIENTKKFSHGKDCTETNDAFQNLPDNCPSAKSLSKLCICIPVDK